MFKTTKALIGFAVVAAMAAAVRADVPIPAHPNELKYPPLEYKIPPADQFRAVLSNGMVVYVAEDRELPVFDLSIQIRTGAAFDPADKVGLASLTGEQLRDGGTQTLTPEELDEKIEFLAARMYTRVSDTEGEAAVSCLSKDIDEALALLVDVLRYPRFDEERLRQAKERLQQNIKRRNDRTATIEGIEWDFLMYGEEHFSNRYPSSASTNSITREDLLAFHGKYFHPGNMIVAVAGDFDRSAVLAKLESVFGAWPMVERAPRTLEKPDHQPTPGVYLVNKEDVNQGRVSVGHLGVMRGSPDEFALRVMNGILGGTGFQSRLTARVRSDEGLAYSVGSEFSQGVYWPGSFRCYFQSKSNACPYAAGLVLEEIERIREQQVSQEELDDTIAYFVESFPQYFQSKIALLETYAGDEYTGRDPAYWQSWIENMKRVTAEDVQRVAQKYLHPDQLVILAVGNAGDIKAGGHDRDPDLKLEAFGPVQEMEPRDPDTLRR